MLKSQVRILRMARYKEVSFQRVCAALDISIDELRGLLDVNMMQLVTVYNDDFPYPEITMQDTPLGVEVCEVDDERRKAVRRGWYMLIIGAAFGFLLDRVLPIFL